MEPEIDTGGDEATYEAAGAAARLHIVVATAFLVVAVTAAAITSYQLVNPGFLGQVAATSFGRILPFGGNSLVIGWLAIGLFGASYYSVSRSVGARLWGGRLALLNLVVVGAATVAGMVGVLAGQNQGRLHLELPWWSDVFIGLALVVGAFIITGTASRRSLDTDSPAVWYAVAGSWFAALAFAVGAVPGPEGMNAAMQEWFFQASFFYGGLLALGLGLVYFMLGEATGHIHSTRLTPIGFWSVVFVAGWLGPAFGVHGPAPTWLETVGVVFSMLLFIPVWTVLTDLALATRGRWQQLRTRVSVHFVVAAAAFLALVPFLNFARALRSPAAVTGLTAWAGGIEVVLFYGVLSLVIFGFVFHTGPRLFPGMAEAADLASLQLWVTVAGVLVAMGGMAIAGLMQGYTWVGGVNSEAYENFGDGYINSVDPLEAFYWMRFAGIALLAAGAALFMIALVISSVPSSPEELADQEIGFVEGDVAEARAVGAIEEAADRDDDDALLRGPLPVGNVIQGAVALFVLAALAVFVVPAFESTHTESSLLAESRDYPSGSAEDDGRVVYQREGCWYCHTQEVRAIVTDVGLGPVSQAGDYALVDAPLLGSNRIGPDLMFAGARENTDDPAWIADHLVWPRTSSDATSRRRWSIMPSYGYLSDSDLMAVSSYIAALD